MYVCLEVGHSCFVSYSFSCQYVICHSNLPDLALNNFTVDRISLDDVRTNPSNEEDSFLILK
jgi:hypothetical protein